MRKLLALIVFVIAFIAYSTTDRAPALQAQAARRAIRLDDKAKIKTVGDPQVSPDGKWVAYSVGTVDVEKDKRETHIWMVSWDGTERIRMTAGIDASESAPRWSPDGRFLAFLASRGDEDQKKKGSQVWLLSRNGGEGQQLTDIKGGVADYAWAPDGKRLALIVNDLDPTAEPEKMDGWKRKTKPPIVIDRYHFKQDRDGYLTRLYTHVSVFDVGTRKADVLTSGNFDDSSPAWSPDGRTIAFVSNRSPDPDRNEDENVYTVEAKSGAAPRQITTFPGGDGGRVSWSPDGQSIAYLQGDETQSSAYVLNKLAIVPSVGGAPKVLTAALDRAVSGALLWAPDGRSIATVVEDDRASYVARVNLQAGTVERITTGRRVVSDLSSRSDGSLALLGASAAEPFEVYVLEKGALRKLTHENDALFADLQLATTEDFTSTSKDGTEVHGLMVKPAGFKAGQRYPTILYIHGGPNGQDEHRFSFEREFFAANGYVVLSVNYRGSAGRGSAFQKAIFADWGNKEVMDLLGAVDQAVSAEIADPARLGIGGWSYGGILTDYTIATDPARFKAAVSGAGSALQLTMYGTDEYVVQYEQELGPPWKSLDPWLKVSYPFLHADRIKTPTLFMGGDRDFNVPVAGGEQMYQALKSLGVDTGLVIYPGQFHSLSIPSYQRDRLERYLAWFNKYLATTKTD
jgi:dipeptidyl aminopeptidase/acylaminoacyl peptidase